jgi:hypothetical protein
MHSAAAGSLSSAQNKFSRGPSERATAGNPARGTEARPPSSVPHPNHLLLRCTSNRGTTSRRHEGASSLSCPGMVPTFNFCAGRASDRRHGRQCEGASTTIPEHLCMSFSSLFFVLSHIVVQGISAKKML